MRNYEIFVLDELLIPSLMVEESHPDNPSAIQSAQKIAAGRGIEVWHGIECVYAHPVKWWADIQGAANR